MIPKQEREIYIYIYISYITCSVLFQSYISRVLSAHVTKLIIFPIVLICGSTSPQIDEDANIVHKTLYLPLFIR